MRGVQRAYYCAPWTPTQLHGAMNFAVSAADARLEVVVALTHSAFNEGHTQTRLETDRKLAEHPSVKPLRERELDFAIANVQ